MEDYKTWLYLLFAVIYFVLQSRKKKKPQPKPVTQGQVPGQRPQTSPQNSPEQERPKPITFQEVLKEILEEQGLGTDGPEEKTDDKGLPQKKQQARPKEDAKSRETQKYQPLKASREYKSLVDEVEPKRKTLETTQAETGLDDAYERGSLFKEFAHEGAKVNPYGEKLKRKSGVREAFIMSEILNRKEY